MFESWIVLCVSGVLFGVAERVFGLAAIAGTQISGWLKLPMLAIWSPPLAGMLFAAVLSMLAARLLRLGSRQPLASNLEGALNSMVAGTASLLPGVPLERAAIVSDTQDVLSGLLSRGPWWALGLMLALIVFGAVSWE